MIRELREEDVPACLRIYNHYIKSTCFTLEEDPLSLEEFGGRIRRIKSKYPFIVKENEEGEIVGYAYLDLFHERSAYRKTVDLSIYVDKSHLHEGMGKELLSNIEDSAKERGFRNIVSIVTSENPNSLDFHLRNGFLLEGTLHDIAFKMGKRIDTYYLRKPLAD